MSGQCMVLGDDGVWAEAAPRRRDWGLREQIVRVSEGHRCDVGFVLPHCDAAWWLGRRSMARFDSVT